MDKMVDTNKLIQKTKQYEFSDGLRDIQIGVLFVFFGGINWVFFHPRWWAFLFKLQESYGEWAFKTSLYAMWVLFILIPIGTYFLIKYIRHRWLWRESGMVTSYLSIVPKKYSVLSGIVFVGILAVGLRFQSFLKTGEFYIWSLVCVAIGWSTGLMFYGIGKDTGLSRYVYIGLFAGLASTTVLFYQSSFVGIYSVLCLGWGAVLLISGLFVLKQVWPGLKGQSYV